jgi:hypothetical protein
LEESACLVVKNIGKPCAGEQHARFDEGGQGKTALDSIIGAYPLMSSSNDFARMKKEEIELEERKFQG